MPYDLMNALTVAMIFNALTVAIIFKFSHIFFEEFLHFWIRT